MWCSLHSFGTKMPSQSSPAAPAVFALFPSPSIQLAKSPGTTTWIASYTSHVQQGYRFLPSDICKLHWHLTSRLKHPAQKIFRLRSGMVNFPVKLVITEKFYQMQKMLHLIKARQWWDATEKKKREQREREKKRRLNDDIKNETRNNRQQPASCNNEREQNERREWSTAM